MSWSIVLRWQPETPGLEVLKQILFGPLTSYPAYDFDTPLVPWFSLYMVASCLGEWLGASHLEKNEARVKAVLIRLGAGSLSLAVLTAGGYELLRAFHLVASHPILYVLLSPFTKRPPSPAYFAFYGGASLLILRVCFELERVTLLNKVIEGARMIGETSLFAFIVEYYVYFALLDWMHLPVTVFWPAYFIVSVILIGVVCSVWYTNGYNRFLTVGFLRIAEGSLTQASAAPRWSHAGQ